MFQARVVSDLGITKEAPNPPHRLSNPMFILDEGEAHETLTLYAEADTG